MRVTLPALPEEHQLLFVLLAFGIFTVIYFVAGLVPLREPTVLPLTVIDERLPIWPWTIWIYISEYILLALAMLLPEPGRRARAFYGMLLANLLAAPIFMFFPTWLPPQSVAIDGITGWAWRLMVGLDVEGNCLPSLHVAMALIAIPSLAATHRIWWLLAPLWAILISLSTMTTEQHALLDVIAGALLALLCLVLVERFARIAAQ